MPCVMVTRTFFGIEAGNVWGFVDPVCDLVKPLDTSCHAFLEYSSLELTNDK